MNIHQEINRLDTTERVLATIIQSIPVLGVALILWLIHARPDLSVLRRPMFGILAATWQGFALGCVFTWNLHTAGFSL
jgi:hypothetical protein